MKCKFCFRETEDGSEVCEYCKPFICELCGARLSRGYCAICGRLVCSEDFKFVGFARVCKPCLEKDPKLLDYNHLRELVASKAREVTSCSGREFTEIIRLGTSPHGEYLYMHIGLDDFDSPYGLCTTYAASKLLQMLRGRFDIKLLDFPLLVRLNPNIPIKTRGNASVAIRIMLHKADVQNLIEETRRFMGKISHEFFKKTQPALAIYLTSDFIIDRVLNWAYIQAVRSVLPISVLFKKLDELKSGQMMVFSPGLRTPRGVVGAIAAIGAVFDDYTFELLAYRRKENMWKRREVDADSVAKMNDMFFPRVFGSINGSRILITPKSPDPVLFGIRGEEPEIIYEAFKMIRHEDIDLWTIFRTNQATSPHIRNLENAEDAHPFETVAINCRVLAVSRSRDKVFLRASSGKIYVEGLSYRLQRQLQSAILKLKQNDTIKLVIAVMERGERLIRGNIEEVIPLELEPKLIRRNPYCPRCCARLKKKAKEEMYCRRCGLRVTKVFKIEAKYPRRELSTRKRYLPSPKAYRHLTMPNERIYFRVQKLLRKIQLFLTEPVLAEQKGVPLVRTIAIMDPEIV